MPSYRKSLVEAAILIALVVIGAAGYWLAPLLLPRSDTTAHPDPGCDLHRGACGATLPGGGRVELAIAPHPIPMLRPLAVEVRISDVTASKAEIDFAGVGMDMGYNRTALAATAPGRFSGSATLPVCITGAMPWQATVLLDVGNQRIAVPFRFDSTPH